MKYENQSKVVEYFVMTMNVIRNEQILFVKEIKFYIINTFFNVFKQYALLLLTQNLSKALKIAQIALYLTCT